MNKFDAGKIATKLLDQLKTLVSTGAALDEHTADQVLIYAALADGVSRMKIPPPSLRTSQHIESAIRVIETFTGAVFHEVLDPEEPEKASLLTCQGVGLESVRGEGART